MAWGGTVSDFLGVWFENFTSVVEVDSLGFEAKIWGSDEVRGLGDLWETSAIDAIGVLDALHVRSSRFTL